MSVYAARLRIGEALARRGWHRLGRVVAGEPKWAWKYPAPRMNLHFPVPVPGVRPRCSPANPCDSMSAFHVAMWGQCYVVKQQADSEDPA